MMLPEHPETVNGIPEPILDDAARKLTYWNIRSTRDV
jgi:hypothetical protein